MNRYRRRSSKGAGRRSLLAGTGAIIITAVAGAGVTMKGALNAPKFNDGGCMISDDTPRTSLTYVDASIFDQATDSQVSDIEKAIHQHHAGLMANVRHGVISNARGENGSVIPGNIAFFCNPPKNAAALAEITDKTIDDKSLAREAAKANRSFTDMLNAKFTVISSPDEMAPESPHHENISAISRAPFRSSLASLVWVTDGVSYSKDRGGMACRDKGALPSAATYLERYPSLRPESFEGVKVTIYLLEPAETGRYCRPGEVKDFWMDWFRLAGVAEQDVSVINLFRGFDDE